MAAYERITVDPLVMGGQPCVRGMRVTVSMIVGLLAGGKSANEVLSEYPYLEPEDVAQALGFAACLAQERDVTD